MQGRIEAEIKLKKRVEKKMQGQPVFIREWVHNMEAKQVAPRTINEYYGKVCSYFSFLEEKTSCSPITLADVTLDSLSNYFRFIQHKEKNGEISKTSSSFINATWFALNKFFTYHFMEGNVQVNYMDRVKPQKNQKTNVSKKDVPTEEELEMMLSGVVGENNHFKIRNKAVLLLLMGTGMRREALCEININDVDLENRTLSIIDKGDEPHIYKLTPETVKTISEWLRLRVFYARDKNSPALFISRLGNRITANVIYDIVTETTFKTIGRAISPHKIRAAYCTIIYKKTGNIEAVRRAVGHKNIETTKRYCDDDGSDREMAADIMESIIG